MDSYAPIIFVAYVHSPCKIIYLLCLNIILYVLFKFIFKGKAYIIVLNKPVHFATD